MKPKYNIEIRVIPVGTFFMFNRLLMRVVRNRLNYLHYEIIGGTGTSKIRWHDSGNSPHSISQMGIEILSTDEVETIQMNQPHLFL